MNQEIITEDLVLAAQGGDPQAWNKLVQHYTPLLWSITRSARLPDADANDVIQTTWLRLVQNLHRIENPAGVRVNWDRYLGHNIACIAVDGNGEIIDFDFNHNDFFRSSAEHAESRIPTVWNPNLYFSRLASC